MPKRPEWKVPKNLVAVLEENDGVWEDERWAPILVTAMSATEFHGREIPIAWEIEFDPANEEFEEANAKLEKREIEPDGYGWGEHVLAAIKKVDRKLAQRLHSTDCELGTCVIWVESEEDCRVLVETVWSLIFGK